MLWQTNSQMDEILLTKPQQIDLGTQIDLISIMDDEQWINESFNFNHKDAPNLECLIVKSNYFSLLCKL